MSVEFVLSKKVMEKIDTDHLLAIIERGMMSGEVLFDNPINPDNIAGLTHIFSKKIYINLSGYGFKNIHTSKQLPEKYLLHKISRIIEHEAIHVALLNCGIHINDHHSVLQTKITGPLLTLR